MKMKRCILCAVALMVTATAATAATTVTPLTPATTKAPLFEKVDTNGDGLINV